MKILGMAKTKYFKPFLFNSFMHVVIVYAAINTAVAQDENVVTCGIQMVGDWFLWQRLQAELGSNNFSLIRSEIIRMSDFIINEMNKQAAILIIETGAPIRVNFSLAKLLVLTSEECQRQGRNVAAFCSGHYGAESLLHMFSNTFGSHEFCYSHLFTARDFFDQVIGASFYTGGTTRVCSQKEGKYRAGMTNHAHIRSKSYYNIANVFIQAVEYNFGIKKSHLDKTKCSTDLSNANREPGVKYIPYYTQSGVYDGNSFLWMGCYHIVTASVMLRQCETEPACGNLVVNQGEECDCGPEEVDNRCLCCHPASNKQLGCKLKTGSECDPSQGPCCRTDCRFVASNAPKATCRDETECTQMAICEPGNAACPQSKDLPDYTPCDANTKICKAGVCTGSICESIKDSSNYRWMPCITEDLPCFLSCKVYPSFKCWNSNSVEDPGFPPEFKMMITQFTGSLAPVPLPGSSCENNQCGHFHCHGTGIEKEPNFLYSSTVDVGWLSILALIGILLLVTLTAVVGVLYLRANTENEQQANADTKGDGQQREMQNLAADNLPPQEETIPSAISMTVASNN